MSVRDKVPYVVIVVQDTSACNAACLVLMDHGAHMRLDLVDQRFGDEFKLYIEQADRADYGVLPMP